MNNTKIRIAITQGDTNGVGLEVIVKALANPEMLDLCTPIVYASPSALHFYAKALELYQHLPLHTIASASEAQDGKLNLVRVGNEELAPKPGQESTEAGEQALLALEAAIADWKDEETDALVTAPINKHSIHSERFPFAGHTEYIEAACGDGNKALMILMNERIRVALVTTHLALADIPRAINEAQILSKLQLFNASLKRDFGLGAPRIAVLSLNPHCGDGGIMGNEETTIIGPAIERANSELGIKAFGPYPTDGFFGAGSYDRFDGVLAMYHDQGLAPFKTIAMDDGVNFTAGLPIVRTSPDHGTAYDIAGQGLADENSLRQAIYTAIDIVRNRRSHDEATANPLGKLYHERRGGHRDRDEA